VTVVVAPETDPTPLIESVVAPVTFHERSELCPIVMLDGVAANDEMVGAASTVVLQVEVATVEDASVTWMVVL
jgi:hypothetical protein